MQPIIIVHGGAGQIPESRIAGKIAGVKLAVKEGYKVFLNGGSAVEAVEAAVRSMEKDENFNAGFGSVLNLDGKVEMEASIMCGTNLTAGAVTLVTDVLHPITLAKLVMENTPHVLLAGNGVKDLIAKYKIPTVKPDSLISKHAKEALLRFKQPGLTEIGHIGDSKIGDTVGAVAIDRNGVIAAATSTGGMNGKMVGRIGDTPQLGSGTYADDFVGGVSTTESTESENKIRKLEDALLENLNLTKTLTAQYEEKLKFMHETIQKNTELKSTVIKLETTVKNAEHENKKLNQETKNLAEFFQNCVLKMDELIEKYKKQSIKKLLTLKQELQLKDVQLSTQRTQMLKNHDQQMECFLDKIEEKYQHLLQTQFCDAKWVKNCMLKTKYNYEIPMEQITKTIGTKPVSQPITAISTRSQIPRRIAAHKTPTSRVRHGETILKYGLAHKIISAMENGVTAQNATKNSIEAMTKRLNNTAGAITLSRNGQVGVFFTSKRMSWAYLKGDNLHYGIEQNEDKTERI